MKETTRLPDERRFLQQTETIDVADLRKIGTYIGLATGRKKLPTWEEILESKKREIRRATERKVREYADEKVKSVSYALLGEKLGKRLYQGKVDYEIYDIVRNSVRKYLHGRPELKFEPLEYSRMKYKDKQVLGWQNGVKAYYVSDPENALGDIYKDLVAKSGLKKDEFDKTFQEYVKVHEEAEAVVQWIKGFPELDESTHGKVQAYVLSALKNIQKEGAFKIYEVGALIDSHRKDAFGHYIKEHADPDIKVDMENFGRKYSSTWN